MVESTGSRTVTPLQLVGAGAVALTLGALAGFSSHYASTAKQLAEDGIDPRSRIKFLPLAGKALAASSAMCIGLGVLAVGGWRLAGMKYNSIAEVSSWQDAVGLAKQQRDVIQQEFQKQLFNKQPDEGQR
ncbi:ABC transporter substrate-binding [Micractinium conductrix]|uniref:ABC transporter substrate-binding n=1 Tax=Micractinium conductrix TaxID=554055 RepID=A0A2P6V8R5_9CHLO|nr:ABC transporter substrate-binding [Micractinium conductrix]|eukprot:PSC70484.1 ABC transporter substrate-binding [Micractinium conductrix]